MECVDGAPITAYCADRASRARRSAAAVPRRVRRGAGRAPARRRASRSQAGQHPGDGRGRGEGSRLRRREAHRHAGVADSSERVTGVLRPLTPNYASPEQVRGLPVTTVSDIYALGVLLYELLTDVRPYDTTAKTVDEILRHRRRREPPRPSARVGGGRDASALRPAAAARRSRRHRAQGDEQRSGAALRVGPRARRRRHATSFGPAGARTRAVVRVCGGQAGAPASRGVCLGGCRVDGVAVGARSLALADADRRDGTQSGDAALQRRASARQHVDLQDSRCRYDRSQDRRRFVNRSSPRH